MSAPDAAGRAVRPLGADEHELIGDIITDAFQDDPVTLWTLRSLDIIRDTFTALAKTLYLKKGFGAVIGDGLGGTLWLPPEVKKEIGPLTTLSIASRVIARHGVTPVRRALAVDDAMIKAKPGMPHYYLFAIGVRPQHQGKGLGRALMEGPLARCDAERVPAYLESSKASNVPFYRSLGFEVTEELRLPLGGPSMWPMWRMPKPRD